MIELHDGNGDRTGHATTLSVEPRSPAHGLLRHLLATSVVLSEDWEALAAAVRDEAVACRDKRELLDLLRRHGLLNDYQADRIAAGTTYGLVVGNYRVLERLGAGAMGVVFKAEHTRMRRVVAVKVLPLGGEQSSRLAQRFFTEMRAVAQLQHPNIVAAIDAGEVPGELPGQGGLHYFVMEYVPGEDLEQYVETRGPLPPCKACDLIHQVAAALAEGHKHQLVHRDIKPSNIRVTPEEQAKLVDFGLARHFRYRQTEPGTVLGTVDYMAPEQARDAGSVDIRADIYSLGGTLFWCLTGRPPFPPGDSLAESMTRRLTQDAPSARVWRSDLSGELDAVVRRMMALRPDDRYATPEAVMRALLPFLKPESAEHFTRSVRSSAEITLPAAPAAASPGHRVLVVDDEGSVRGFCRYALEAEGLACHEAGNGVLALEAAAAQAFDLVLLDIDMPEMNGAETLRRLRDQPPCPHLKIIMFSGRATPDEMAQMLTAGADGYITKPFSLVQLCGQVRAALRLKEAQDRADLLNQRLLGINAELERTLCARDSDLIHARNALVLALANLVRHRDGETGRHGVRLRRYCRALAEAAAASPAFAGQIEASFIDMLECCAPLHDVGKVGLPDHILMKPGKLTAEERVLMQAHTVIGAETLKGVAAQHGSALAFLQMAIDIVRHHHERYDGTGYPDRLAGSDIPLAARIVAIGDVYDALRSRRVYKPALSHVAAVQVMMECSPGQFDPALLAAFQQCAPVFERVFQEMAD